MAGFVKIENNLYTSPKWWGLSNEARGVWLNALLWSNIQETYGRLDNQTLTMLQATPEVVDELVKAELWDVEAGLWDEDDMNVWHIHDFEDICAPYIRGKVY